MSAPRRSPAASPLPTLSPRLSASGSLPVADRARRRLPPAIPADPPLFRVGLDVLHDVVHRLDLLGFLVRDLDPELLFHLHHELHDIEGISAQVVDERRAR